MAITPSKEKYQREAAASRVGIGPQIHACIQKISFFERRAEGGKEQSLGCLAIADQPQPLNHSRKCGSISLELHSVHFMPLLLHCSLEHVGLP